MSKDSNIRIVLVGIGGQGVIFASKVIGGALMGEGLNVLMSEVHGMAQRGGVVTCQICAGEVHSPMIGDGGADVMLAFEPVEAYRLIHKANKNTTIITNTEPEKPLTANFGEVEYPDVEEVLRAIREVTDKLTAIKGTEIARSLGSQMVMNSVMLGALAGTGRLPFTTQVLRDSLSKKVPEQHGEMNARAFDAGLAAVKR